MVPGLRNEPSTMQLTTQTNNTQGKGFRMTAVAKLRELLADRSKLLVCPGVYDGLTARIAIKAGFECLYMVQHLFLPGFLTCVNTF